MDDAPKLLSGRFSLSHLMSSFSLVKTVVMNSTQEIIELIRELKNEISQTQRPANEVIYDDVDLRQLLKVSRRTIAEWRANKLITFSKVQGKIFYRLSDILDFLDRNKVQC